MFKVPCKNRVKTGRFGSDNSYGNNGMFLFRQKKNKPDLTVIASDQLYWEHVSVSTPNRTPTWEEMCMLKDKFWGKDDCVVQYHPPESEYINNHPFCLHMWRPIGVDIPMPPSIMVGVK